MEPMPVPLLGGWQLLKGDPPKNVVDYVKRELEIKENQSATKMDFTNVYYQVVDGTNYKFDVRVQFVDMKRQFHIVVFVSLKNDVTITSINEI